MNLGEMRLDVRDRIGEKTPNFWTDEFITRKLNAGQTRFAHEEKWHWLYALQSNIPLLSGTNQIELIDGIDLTRHFSLTLYKSGSTEPVLPKRVTAHTGARLRQRHTTVGEPAFWYPVSMVKNTYGTGDPAEWSHVIRVVPSTDQAYTAEYFYLREPTKMVAEDDECDIPESYQEAVIAWATAQCWLKELNGGRKAQEEFNIYNTVLEQAQADMKENAHDTISSWGGDPVDRPTPIDELKKRLFTVPLGG